MTQGIQYQVKEFIKGVLKSFQSKERIYKH